MTLVQSEGVECVKVLKGLVPASAYEVCLRALSGSGHSPWSQPLGFETTPSIPGAPLHLSVVRKKTKQITDTRNTEISF